MLCLFGCGRKMHSVDYEGRKDEFTGARDKYREGEKVTLKYRLIATDTDYHFYIDGQSINPDYNDKDGFIISFTMPDRDIKVTVESYNSMVIQNYNNNSDASQFMETAELTFDSFAGGGPEYTAVFDDDSICMCERQVIGTYYDEPVCGGSITYRFTITGLKEGTARMTVSGASPIAEYPDTVYIVTVNSYLQVNIVKADEEASKN